MSIAAVAAAAYLSNKKIRRAVAAVAAMASLTGVRLGSKARYYRQTWQVQNMVQIILTNLTQLKMVMRKSLSLIQSMEVVNSVQ